MLCCAHLSGTLPLHSSHMSAAEIEKAKSQIQATGENGELAKRALTSLRVEHTEDNIILWLALSYIKGPTGRVTKKFWDQHTTKVVQQTKVEISFYLVQRADMPSLPAESTGKVVDPLRITVFRLCFAHEDVWVPKNNFPKHLLLTDFAKLKSSCGSVRELQLLPEDTEDQSVVHRCAGESSQRHRRQ